jgi:hypothetical protein
MKRLLALLLTPLASAALLGVVCASPAAAATRCQGGTGSGRCITVSNVKRHLRVVESVSLENKSSKTVTMHCSFTKTVTRSTTGSISLTIGVKAQIFKVAEASTSIDITNSITQSSSQATTAGGSVRLKAHQSVMCQRTYGYVKASVKQVDHTSRKSVTKYYTVTIPVSMGARIIDL